jgi:hypothetical protein
MVEQSDSHVKQEMIGDARTSNRFNRLGSQKKPPGKPAATLLSV